MAPKNNQVLTEELAALSERVAALEKAAKPAKKGK